jgi:hypothetical protein
MGRDDHNKQSDAGRASPQSPHKEFVSENEQYELAEEAEQLYELEQKPGFPPTGIRRKDRQ